MFKISKLNATESLKKSLTQRREVAKKVAFCTLCVLATLRDFFLPIIVQGNSF